MHPGQHFFSALLYTMILISNNGPTMNFPGVNQKNSDSYFICWSNPWMQGAIHTPAWLLMMPTQMPPLDTGPGDKFWETLQSWAYFMTHVMVISILQIWKSCPCHQTSRNDFLKVSSGSASPANSIPVPIPKFISMAYQRTTRIHGLIMYATCPILHSTPTSWTRDPCSCLGQSGTREKPKTN